jgi:hypothetical protein
MARSAMPLIPLILATMKRCLFLVLASCLMFAAQAQRVYFIYLQSENAQPFFVKMSEKVYSSSATGYVILSNLKDSTYNFSVGFPGGKVAEKRFGVQINQGDRGFLLKNFDDGLGLFDLQSLGVIKAIAAADVPGNVQMVAKTDAFTRLLAEAADDESLLTTAVVVKTEAPRKEVKKEVEVTQKPDIAAETKVEPKSDVIAVVDSNIVTTKPEKPAVETAKTEDQPLKQAPVKDLAVATVPAKDTSMAIAPVKKEEVKELKADVKTEEAKTDLVKEEVKKDTVASQPVQPIEPVVKAEEKKVEETPIETAPYKRSVVTKRSESSTTEGFGLVFYDQQDGVVDTIRMLIPNPKKPFVEEAVVKEAETQKLEEPVKKDLEAKTDVEIKKEEPTKIGEAEKAEPKEEERKSKDVFAGLFKAPKSAEPAIAVENMKCTALATDKDFLKVRKNMAAESNDEAMIDEAKVFFRAKCFTTEQIKNLSSLFLTSAAKYQFFDAAYPHVTDPSKFPALQSEIKDPYYLKRFQALIGQ